MIASLFFYFGGRKFVYFFSSAQNFFLYALLCFHPFSCLRSSCGCKIPYYFFSLRVSSPFRSVPSVLRVHGSAPCVRARRSSFSPRRARKAERAFRVRIGRNVWLRMKVEDTQRAKRLCFRVSFFNFHSRAFSGTLLFIVRNFQLSSTFFYLF